MRRYIKKAADGGLAKARSFYGSYLILAENNPKEGLDYIEKAAQDENLEALLSIGYYLADGKYLAKDGVKALNYFARAAERGDPEGIFSAIAMERNLFGKTKNLAKAIEDLTPMANHGFEQPKMILDYFKRQPQPASRSKPKKQAKRVH
jgi:TPR repeat protein